MSHVSELENKIVAQVVVMRRIFEAGLRNQPKALAICTDLLAMRHVNAIKNIVADGRFEEAHRAIEDLLELGPNNVEALKLKAALYEHVGRFDDEWKTWKRILDNDSEDEEAINFFQRSQLEDREHYYFTDPLPGGGRQFLAYPRALVTVSCIGLMGCILFLLVTRTDSIPLSQSPALLLSTFIGLVIGPWIAIIYLYVQTLRSINVTKTGLEVTTRFKNFTYDWQNIRHIYLACSEDPNDGELRLVIVPQEPGKPMISIDFAEASSPVRARKHLVQEIRDHFRDIGYKTLNSLPQDKNHLIRF